jgi:hydroxypyruvate reductase
MTAPIAHAEKIFRNALADCGIDRAMARHLRVQDGNLEIAGETISLTGLHRLCILAAGKAASTMLTALLQHLPPLAGCALEGVLIAPESPSALPAEIQFFAGGHPLPNEASFAGARAALDMLERAAFDADFLPTVCLFLISGGASAMLELPLAPEISLDDTIQFHRVLVGSGAPIAEMNCVRKHFSAVKGGRLARAAGSARCFTLLVSDVPETHIDALGSGPTIGDSSTVAECREILARYNLLAQFPATVRQFFEQPDLPETPKTESLISPSLVLLSSKDLANAATRQAEALGYSVVIDNTCDEWDYAEAADYLLNRLRVLRRENASVCLISAGEVGVKLPTDAKGHGGRNQQFALYAALQLAAGEEDITILSAGSDGIDGNSNAAGAVISRALVASPADREAAETALREFNATPFLTSQNAAILLGPTGNNLRDLRLLLTKPANSLH